MILLAVVPSPPEFLEIGKERKVNEREGDVSHSGSAGSFVKTQNAFRPDEIKSQGSRRQLKKEKDSLTLLLWAVKPLLMTEEATPSLNDPLQLRLFPLMTSRVFFLSFFLRSLFFPFSIFFFFSSFFVF